MRRSYQRTRVKNLARTAGSTIRCYWAEGTTLGVGSSAGSETHFLALFGWFGGEYGEPQSANASGTRCKGCLGLVVTTYLASEGGQRCIEESTDA